MYRNDGNRKLLLSIEGLVSSLVFVLFFAAQSWAAESSLLPGAVSPDAGLQEWLQIPTQNAGLLSLPSAWDLVSKDGTVERKLDADRMLHVQQALYASARSNRTLDAPKAVLQIFSIWNADGSGKILPLPPDILEKTNGDFVAALIDSRYGNVKKLTQETIGTDLEDLSVTTYGVEFLQTGKNPEKSTEKSSQGRESKEPAQGLRYKCASLFCGEKLVLVLVKYFPEDEDHWRREFGALLNAWVASLTLTPRPLAEIPKLSVSLPELPSALPSELPREERPPLVSPSFDASPTVSAVSNAAEPSGDIPGLSATLETAAAAPEAVTPAPQNDTVSSFVLYAGLALPVLVIFFVCAGKFFDWRRKKQEETISADFDPDRLSLEETMAEAETETTIAMTEPAENPYSFKEDINREDINQETFDEEPAQENNDDRAADFGWPQAEELVLPLSGDTRDLEAQRDPLPEKLGFDRVYSLLNQALVSIDTAQIAPAPVTYDKRVTQSALPNLSEAIEVLDDLEALLGQSFVLDALKEEVLKVMEIKEGTPMLQTKDVTPEYFLLKLCCSTLLNMLQTGRYHIGKGILSNEGEELVNLFGRINDLRTQKAYSSPEEAEKDAAFLQFCVRELE
ncbi:MAG: hypothetical protein LBS00_12960 [Synergistaceae bacterium]|jgi:hypothetical protein|nr:hypothetical protein [Synergistaceae bacterium]